MKKTILAILMLVITPTALPRDIPSQPVSAHSWVNTAQAVFLLGAGSWLAHKQLPRLAGQVIEYNSPTFTKIGATVLFAIGIIGGIAGASTLIMQLHNKFNKAS